MPYTTIDKLFDSPWGIVEHCRAEIEAAGSGMFKKIVAREVSRQFPSARLVAEMMECSESTARKWMRDHDASFIFEDGITRYLKKDVNIIKDIRNQAIKDRVERKSKKGLQS